MCSGGQHVQLLLLDAVKGTTGVLVLLNKRVMFSNKRNTEELEKFAENYFFSHEKLSWHLQY